MKIIVYVTSGSYEYWKGVMERAGSELGFAFFMELRDIGGIECGVLELNGFKDFLKMCEYLDEDIIIRPKWHCGDGADYDMIIEIYDEWREDKYRGRNDE